MERSAIRDFSLAEKAIPDYAALHPGYGSQFPYNAGG